MIRKIVDLNAGDSLIQNAGNSAVGLNVIQMAKAKGIKTINVIRTRPNLQTTVDKLVALGADVVITDEELKQNGLKNHSSIPAPKLALDAVAGSAANDLVSVLAEGGTLCNYGVLSGKPCEIGAADFIFKGIKATGFWVSQYVYINKFVEFFLL